MRTLKIIEHMSLDGVMQNSRDDNDFPYGDWTASYRTPAGRDMVMASSVLEDGDRGDVGEGLGGGDIVGTQLTCVHSKQVEGTQDGATEPHRNGVGVSCAGSATTTRRNYLPSGAESSAILRTS